MSCANSAQPLGLTIENVTVSSDGKAVLRGVAVGIGNPQQVMSLSPTTSDSNAWLFLPSACSSTTNDTCLAFNGGEYNSAASTTFAQTTKDAWNGTHDSQAFNWSVIYFNDQFRVGTSAYFEGFPLSILDGSYGGSASPAVGM